MTKKLYHKWLERLTGMLPDERQILLKNFAGLLVGIYFSGSVHLSKISRPICGSELLVSRTRRLRRLVNNNEIEVMNWYEPVAEDVLSQIAADQPIRLIIDGSRIGSGHQLLMVSVAYRKRSIPICWTWVKQQRGHSTTRKQMALLRQVYALIPDGRAVILVGDSEFGAVNVQKQLEKWKWGYVLRQKGRTHIKLKYQRKSRRLDSYVDVPNQAAWFPQTRLTAKYQFPTTLLIFWQKGEKTPWLLATNLPDQKSALRAYKYRMWIEEMFGDFKGNGFDLESTHLRHSSRLSRLTLAVVLLFVWLLAFGSQVIKHGKRRFVDRKDRRDLSLFRIGCNWLQRCFNNDFSFKISFTFYA